MELGYQTAARAVLLPSPTHLLSLSLSLSVVSLTHSSSHFVPYAFLHSCQALLCRQIQGTAAEGPPRPLRASQSGIYRTVWLFHVHEVPLLPPKFSEMLGV